MSNHFQIKMIQEQLQFQTQQAQQYAAIADAANNKLNEVLDLLAKHDPEYVQSFRNPAPAPSPELIQATPAPEPQSPPSPHP